MYLKSLCRKFSTKIPAIGFDVDGVLARGKTRIPGADNVIKTLRKPLKQLNPAKFKDVDDKLSIPFVLLTNGGGVIEEKRAALNNKILDLHGHDQILSENMIMCHTPLQELVDHYRGKWVMVAGLGELHTVAEKYGFNPFFTLDEYSAMYPYLCPLARKEPYKLQSEAALNRVKKRFGDKVPDTPPPIEAVMMMADPTLWEENLQIVSDLLISKDGIPGSIRSKDEKQFVKFYNANPDFLYADAYHIPRHAQGSFLFCLEALFRRQFGMEIDCIHFGKPTRNTFGFAERKLKNLAKADISNFYMIGDNPEGDIKGSNDMGWNSILVRTGLFQGGENDEEHPAKYVVNDVGEALNLILKKEGIIE